MAAIEEPTTGSLWETCPRGPRGRFCSLCVSSLSPSTPIVTILLCRISLHTFPTARCCLGVPWPVVHVCPLGSWPSLSWGPFRVFLAFWHRLVPKIDRCFVLSKVDSSPPHHLVVSIWPPWLAPETWRWARKLKITLRQKGYLWKVCTSRILYFIFRKSLTKVAVSSNCKSNFI